MGQRALCPAAILHDEVPGETRKHGNMKTPRHLYRYVPCMHGILLGYSSTYSSTMVYCNTRASHRYTIGLAFQCLRFNRSPPESGGTRVLQYCAILDYETMPHRPGNERQRKSRRASNAVGHACRTKNPRRHRRNPRALPSRIDLFQFETFAFLLLSVCRRELCCLATRSCSSCLFQFLRPQ